MGLLTRSTNPPIPIGSPSPNGQIKDLLGQFRNTLQDGASAREDDSGGEQISHNPVLTTS